MKNILLTILIVLAVQLYGVPYNQEFQVNTYTENFQDGATISKLSNGGFVVCWTSDDQDGSGEGVFGQLFDQNGDRKGNEFQVNTYTNGDQISPTIAALTDGGCVICWESKYQDGSGYGIFGQLLYADGNKKGSEIQINSSTNDDQITATIATFSNSRFMVFWQSGRYGGGIFGQMFDEIGHPVGQEFKVNTSLSGSGKWAIVTVLTDNKFVVCWHGSDGTGYCIWAQLFDPIGNKIGNEIQVNTYTNGDQWIPQIVLLKNGGFAVFWQSSGHQDGSDYGIFGQLFDAMGNINGNEFQVNTYTKNNQWNPAVSELSSGEFVVSWESDGQDGSGYGIYGQLFDEFGNKKGNEFQVNTYSKNHQLYKAQTVLADDNFVICWESEYQDGSGYGIFGQLFNKMGNRIGSEFQVNFCTKNDQKSIVINALLDNGYVVCWQSFGQDGSGYGIYGTLFLNEPINHRLKAFRLNKPLNDATLETIRPTFTWYQASTIRECYPWELTYELILSSDSNFSTATPAVTNDTTWTPQFELTPSTTYFWKVLAKNIAGDSLWSTETNGFFVSEDATSVEEISLENPQSFELLSNFPNPFNPETTIKYALPAGQSSYYVVIKIVDALGRVVQVLKDTEQSPGLYAVQWNAQDNPSGVYFCVIQAGEFKAVRKMMLVR